MKESRFKLTIEHHEQPSVIVPIRMTSVDMSKWKLNPEFDKATHEFVPHSTEMIKIGPPPKSPVTPPPVDSESSNNGV